MNRFYRGLARQGELAPALTAAVLRQRQHAMNPASIVFPPWPEEVQAQKTRRSKIWAEGAVIILNAAGRADHG